MSDKRAVLHVAGPGFGPNQTCARCHCKLNSGGYSDSHWTEGATVANHGHGGWSRLETPAMANPEKYRPCVGRKA